MITTIVLDAGFCFLQLELGIGVGRDVFGVGTWSVGRYTRFHKGHYLFSSILLIPNVMGIQQAVYLSEIESRRFFSRNTASSTFSQLPRHQIKKFSSSVGVNN